MTDYTELVKALRHYSNVSITAAVGELVSDAAAAIEALQKRIVSALTALHLANEKMGYYGIQPYTEADGEDMISDWVKTLVHEELKQQLPKRGEWIDSKERMRPDMCSVCGCVYEADRFMDKIAWNYCPNCGARMDGERREA